MATAFLFDLDMTLVDSSAVAQLRSLQMWAQVAKNMNLVRPFKVAEGLSAHELPGKWKIRGVPVGIVTNSPRHYAEPILKAFQIEYDQLVSYGDTKQHKPDPEPLLEALKRLGVKPSREVYYVGDDSVDVEAAYHAGVSSVGVGWGISSLFGMSSTAPDILVSEPSELARKIDLDQLGYIGERIAADEKYMPHWGSVLHCDDSGNEVYALGRYMTASDPRHAHHQLSRAILSLKNDDETAEVLGVALGSAIAEAEIEGRYIVPVPPKPSQQRHRFKLLLDEAKQYLPKGRSVSIDGLKCVKEVEGYKSMGPWERAEAIKGAFETGYKWNGNSVLLIDDVYTTGETIAECVRVLKENGAGDVRTLVLGKDQRTFERRMCGNCGRSMRIRKSRKGELFWGCSGYPHYCQNTENL